MSPLGTVDLRIPAKAEWVAVARLAVAAVGSRLKFSVEEIEDLKLAIAEACTNCIQQAAVAESIEIKCEASSDELKVTVRDDGKGVRLESVKSATGEDPRVGGLGVFLIRSLMDVVEYDADPEGGTRLVMTKRVTN